MASELFISTAGLITITELSAGLITSTELSAEACVVVALVVALDIHVAQQLSTVLGASERVHRSLAKKLVDVLLLSQL